MTEFERQVYRDMQPVDRALLWAVKVMELLELEKLMGSDEVPLIRALLEEPKVK